VLVLSQSYKATPPLKLKLSLKLRLRLKLKLKTKTKSKRRASPPKGGETKKKQAGL